MSVKPPITPQPETHDEGAARVTLTLETAPPAPGLYLLAVPIGAARDVTLHVLDLLNTAEILAAEDTRTLRRLMTIHGVPLRGRRIFSYHEHNEAESGAGLMAALQAGHSVAYAAEAGTPSISDPGFRLAREAAAAGIAVHAVPGPSAVLAALVASGLPSDRFLFAGFAPATAGARQRWLRQVLSVDATVIIFESPRRVKRLFEDLCVIDPERETVICRELTKRFEEVRRGPAHVLAQSGLEEMRGEIVVLVDRGHPKTGPDGEADMERQLTAAFEQGLSVRDASDQVARATGLPRREVYSRALKLGRQGKGRDDGA